MGERRTATYKIITDSGGNRYTFFCDLTGALVCTTKKTYKADTPEQELLRNQAPCCRSGGTDACG